MGSEPFTCCIHCKNNIYNVDHRTSAEYYCPPLLWEIHHCISDTIQYAQQSFGSTSCRQPGPFDDLKQRKPSAMSVFITSWSRYWDLKTWEINLSEHLGSLENDRCHLFLTFNCQTFFFLLPCCNDTLKRSVFHVWWQIILWTSDCMCVTAVLRAYFTSQYKS